MCKDYDTKNLLNYLATAHFQHLTKQTRPLLLTSTIETTCDKIVITGYIFHAAQKNKKHLECKNKLGTFVCTKKLCKSLESNDDIQEILNENKNIAQWNFKPFYTPSFDF